MGYERFIFWFWESPNNRFTCMQGQKTLSLSYNMHLFLPYLLNDSQTIRSTIHFSKPLLCVKLICGDWSIGLIFISSCLWCLIKQHLWAQCCFVYSVTGETAILPAPKAAPSGKEWICIFIQTNAKRPTSGRQYANVSCFIRFKNDSFQWFRVNSFFWETITLYMVHFQI